MVLLTKVDRQWNDPLCVLSKCTRLPFWSEIVLYKGKGVGFQPPRTDFARKSHVSAQVMPRMPYSSQTAETSCSYLPGSKTVVQVHFIVTNHVFQPVKTRADSAPPRLGSKWAQNRILAEHTRCLWTFLTEILLWNKGYLALGVKQQYKVQCQLEHWNTYFPFSYAMSEWRVITGAGTTLGDISYILFHL